MTGQHYESFPSTSRHYRRSSASTSQLPSQPVKSAYNKFISFFSKNPQPQTESQPQNQQTEEDYFSRHQWSDDGEEDGDEKDGDERKELNTFMLICLTIGLAGAQLAWSVELEGPQLGGWSE